MTPLAWPRPLGMRSQNPRYAQLITSVEQIKHQMQQAPRMFYNGQRQPLAQCRHIQFPFDCHMPQVQKNCSRSTQLLTDLSSEKVRWQGSSKGFQEQTASMIRASIEGCSAVATQCVILFQSFLRPSLGLTSSQQHAEDRGCSDLRCLLHLHWLL